MGENLVQRSSYQGMIRWRESTRTGRRYSRFTRFGFLTITTCPLATFADAVQVSRDFEWIYGAKGRLGRKIDLSPRCYVFGF